MIGTNRFRLGISCGQIGLEGGLDTLELLLKRRSVLARNMVTPGPNKQQLEDILMAGIRVPDHGKMAPWRVQIIDDQGQNALGEVFAEIVRQETPDVSAEQLIAERQRPCRAPVLLAVSQTVLRHHKIPVIEQRLSAGAFCQNILVAAHASGFVAQWLTEWPSYHDGVKAALGHDPETDIVGFIYIGSANEAPQERNRAGPETVVSTWSGPQSA